MCGAKEVVIKSKVASNNNKNKQT